jgi:hypothetical protein
MTRPDQLTIDDVWKLGPEEIDAALKAGKFDDLLGRPDPTPRPPPLTADQVERASAAGRLDELLAAHRSWEPSARERVQAMTPEELTRRLRAGELDDVLKGGTK